MKQDAAADVVKAAIEWAKQRQRFMSAQSLGRATSRAALQRKAEKLSFLALTYGVENAKKS